MFYYANSLEKEYRVKKRVTKGGLYIMQVIIASHGVFCSHVALQPEVSCSAI